MAEGFYLFYPPQNLSTISLPKASLTKAGITFEAEQISEAPNNFYHLRHFMYL